MPEERRTNLSDCSYCSHESGSFLQILENLRAIKKKYEEILGEKHKNLGIVICGDLNDIPGSSPIEVFKRDKELNLANQFEKDNFTFLHVFLIILD